MGRLTFFLLTIVGLFAVYSLKSYQAIEVNNERFDFEKAKKSHTEKVLEIEKLHVAAAMRYAPKVVEEVEVVQGPLVELSTPELQKGHDLYGKCVVCHGKRGEGKKSQNAPAIGGQFDWYIVSQLQNMKNKTRINKVMDPYIKKLSDSDFNDLANYISKLPKAWAK
ncbi:MAG: c-type cytochrome [Bacteriovoracaceae bacterium]|nr:c-type cytochrome [Bacteriovoracaceae bacterium]